ncbi:beta-mannosidase [Neocloeon triangulifer]|uniref:beta-mannosidase n=1 Tax=Neocloeon triangulifer TaxID=2078957 RepID=UPI00286F4B7E|nr:beta-mannosidase [Neocloeon triangulifer]
MAFNSLVILLVLFTAGPALCVLQYDLGALAADNVWTVVNKNGSISVSATVPGGIYSDLRSANIIDSEFYYRFNDHLHRWVGLETWTYSRQFTVPAELTAKKQINLVFEGIDTYGQIFINNEVPVTVDNMFVRYVIPFTLQTVNTITVVLPSTVEYAANRSATTFVAPACVVPEYQGECHANQVRKMQASFSWDWGPAFPSAGIWKNVYVEAYDTLLIRDTIYDIQFSEADQNWNVNVRVHAEALSRQVSSGAGDLELQIQVDNVTITSRKRVSYQNIQGEISFSISTNIPASSVQTWWPNGIGKSRKIYTSRVTYTPDGVTETAEKDNTIAFRTLRVVQDFVDPNNITKGRHFYFEVNGQPIFMKGSNWIPAHVLPEIGSDPKYAENLLRASAEADFNMLRVWGGGVYESDRFYQLCDELGILVWQDFLFACSMYPVDGPYLDSVRTEIVQTVRRLQHHPSIALWAGNNENEAALIGNWYQTQANFSAYKDQYIQLYVDTLKPLVNIEDPTRAYLVSSPSNGIKSEEDGFISNDPYSALYGDIHYYNYLADGWDPAVYPRTRFASEFGFQSYPSMWALRQDVAAGDLDLGLNSEIINQRQHHPGGNAELKLQIEHRLLPGGQYNWDNLAMFEKFTYLTQIYQAMATKTEAECHRRWRGWYDEPTGEGLTMGSLYWQLNDIWNAPTWAGIQHDGTWKMMHYYAAKIFSPLHLSAYVTPDRRLSLHAITDLLDNYGDVKSQINVHSWSQLEPLLSLNYDFTLQNNSAFEVNSQPLAPILESAGCGNLIQHAQSRIPEDACFLVVQLLERSTSELLAENFVILSRFADAVGIVVRPQLQINGVTLSTMQPQFSRYVQVFDIQITTDNVAPFVWLDAADAKGRFSDNGFILTNSTKTVQYYALETLTAADLQAKLTITSLTHNWL